MKPRPTGLPTIGPAAASRAFVRVPSLDGWRACAILLVLVGHTVFAGHAPFENLGYLSMCFDGEFGVRVFFILSGFIITHLLAREADSVGHVSLRNFYVRRALRILPVYLAYLIVLAVLSAIGRYHDTASSWIGAATFTRNYVGLGNSATTHFWTLAIEEQFYLLWPIAFVGARLWRRERLAFGLLGVVLVVCPLIRLSPPAIGGDLGLRLLGARSLTRYADSLAIGCAMALLYRRHAARLESGLSAWSWSSLAAVILFGQWIEFSKHYPAAVLAFAPLAQGVALAVVVLFSTAPSAGPLHRFLNQRGVVRLGVLSYSLYVWHLLFLSHFMGPSWSDLPTHHWTTWWIGVGVVAALSYRFIERPFLGLRGRFAPPFANS